MNNQLYAFVAHKFKEWLVHETECTAIPLYDVNRSSLEIRPCDVLLVKGRSRVSKAIRFITQSPWTHCALYIGRLDDTRDPDIRARIQQRCDPEQNEQLLAEALPGGESLSIRSQSIERIGCASAARNDFHPTTPNA